MFRALRIVVIAGFILFTAPIQAATLFTNGSFTSNASGWTGGGGCAGGVFDGSFGNPAGSVLLNSCGEADSDPFIQQLVAGLTPGATYIVSVDVHLHVNIGANGKTFGIFVNQGGPNVPILLTEFLDNAWHTGVTASFIASTTSHLITFAAELDTRTAGVPSNSDVSYYVDNAALNVQAVGAPEPSVFWLLGSGLSVVLLLKRRR